MSYRRTHRRADLHRSLRRFAVLPVAGALSVALLTPSIAADWYARPSGSVGFEYNDNAGLSSRSDEEIETTGYIYQGALQTGYVAPTSSLWLRPRLRFRRYPDDDALNSDDQFVDMYFLQQGERSRWGTRGRYTRQQVRTAELADVDLGPEDPDFPEGEVPDEGDSGIVELRARRYQLRLSPFWEWDLTQKSELVFDARLRDTRYNNNDEDRYTDFQAFRGGLDYVYDLSPVTSWITGVFGEGFYPDDSDDVNGFGFHTGFDHDLSETVNLEVLAGLETADPENGSNETDWIGSATITQRLETIWLRARYQRSLSGSGSGAVSVRDQVNLGFRRELTERLTGGIGLVAYTTDAISGDRDDRDYLRLRTEFVWSLAQDWFVQANYQYTLVDRDDESESANSNQIFLVLQWVMGSAGPRVRAR